MTKWWLVSDEVVKEVIQALTAANATLGSGVVSTYRDTLNGLERGLHKTDAKPEDYWEARST